MLLTQGNTTRGVAIDSVTHTREPFAPISTSPINAGQRARIIIFGLNFSGADASALSVDAEDELHRHYNLQVEFVGPLAGAEPLGVTQVVVKLADDLGAVGDVLVQLTYNGIRSNRVRIGIGFIGGGLPDDVSRLAGRVLTSSGTPLNGAILNLSGAASATTFSDSSGNFAFSNLPQNNTYTVTVAKANYVFAPLSRTFTSLAGNPSADFTGTLVTYNLSGKLSDGVLPLAGVTVSLGGSQSQTTTTDAGGNYLFTVPAEGNYTVTPPSQLYSFNPSSVVIFNLSSNHVFNFAAVARPVYMLSGHLFKNGNAPMGNATVTLSGSLSATTTTDSTGYYVFYNVPAAGNYTVTPSKPNYSFAPINQSYNNLDRNQTKDFSATQIAFQFTISGQVLDLTTPIQGVTVTLSGSQAASTVTDPNGNFAFTVPAEGTYTVVPSHPNHVFTPPGATAFDLGSNRIFNFKSANLYHVLEFDGSPQSVDYGEFFNLQPGQTQLGKFFWEVWAMPGDNAYARYMISDGYGGAHALLFGFVGDGRGTRYAAYGNVYNGVTAIDFGADDGPAPFEWGHVAVGWDGEYIYTYYNGVPVGQKVFAGPRMPAGSDNGGGRLYIGGSDHNNFNGHIEQVRGFENVNPHDNGLQTVTFRPDNLFGLTPGTAPGPRSSFLTNFLRPSLVVPDLAGGRTGVVRAGWPVTNPVSTYPLPQFVIDTNAPNSSAITGPVSPNGRIDTQAPVPANAIVFDSFSRKTSTYAFNGQGGLGSTEGGSAGIKAWKTAGTGGNASTVNINEFFGIINGRAVVLSDSIYGCLAWIEPGSATGYLLTSVSRDPGFYKSGIDTGISFRVADASNYFFAFTYGDPLNASPRKLIVGYWLNSQVNYLVLNVPMPADWRKLQVLTTNAGIIKVYADSELVYSTTSSVLANATGVGLFNYSGEYALANRWDSFTVYDSP